MKKLVVNFLKGLGYRIYRIDSKEEKKKTSEISYKQNAYKYGWLKKYDLNKIVDVGANDGHFAFQSSLVFDRQKYFCFEPIPQVLEKLQKRFDGNATFFFFNFAVGDKNEKSFINVNDYSPSSSILEMDNLHKEAFSYTQHTIKQEIEIRTLDSFMDVIKPGRDTLVKIDVQGYELKVIGGGKDFLSKCGVIIIEMSYEILYKGQPLFHDVYCALHAIGYDYHGNIEQLNHPQTGEILQADACFINRKFLR